MFEEYDDKAKYYILNYSQKRKELRLEKNILSLRKLLVTLFIL